MTAIFKREFISYFTSALGYVFLAVFYFFAGFFFYQIVLLGNSTRIGMICSQLFTIVVFIIPIITMRLLSDDKRQKTDQALLTSPVSLSAIVYGKYLAAFTIFASGVLITLVYAFVMSAFRPLNWPEIFGNVVGLLLMGGAMISIGLLISAMTESQVVAAVITFGVSLGLLLMEMAAGSVNHPILSAIVNGLSFQSRYQPFTSGLFNISNVLYFISVVVVFNFITVRVIEKRRWS